MASIARTRRSLVRRSAVLLTVVMAGGGLVALEHTATGATTGTPSNGYGHQVTTTTKHKSGEGEQGDKHHHGSTTTTSTTTTTMPHRNCPGEHGRKHDEKKFKCRQPSGGQDPHQHDHLQKHDDKKNGYK